MTDTPAGSTLLELPFRPAAGTWNLLRLHPAEASAITHSIDRGFTRRRNSSYQFPNGCESYEVGDCGARPSAADTE